MLGITSSTLCPSHHCISVERLTRSEPETVAVLITVRHHLPPTLPANYAMPLVATTDIIVNDTSQCRANYSATDGMVFIDGGTCASTDNSTHVSTPLEQNDCPKKNKIPKSFHDFPPWEN
jgi:hypothetical protein